MPEAPPAGGRRDAWAAAGVTAWYLGWFGILTWPLAGAPGRLVLGDEFSGVWRTLWAHQWTLRRLLADGSWPLDAPEIGFPRGGRFASIAPVNDLLSLVPQLLFGLVAAYNLVMVFQVLLAATGGYHLARAAGTGRGGGVVSGTVLGFNAFLLTYGVASAVVETSTIGWVAWFFVAVLWLARRPGPASATAAGLLFAVAGLASTYWALLGALMVPVIGLPAVRDTLRGRPRTERRRFLAWLAGAVLVAAVSFGVPARVLMATYLDDEALLGDYATRKQELLDPQVQAKLAHDYATADNYLLPGARHLVAHEDMDLLVQSTYAGWVALVLASFGLGRRRWRWLGLALAAAVLSLGPFTFVSAESWRPHVVWWWDGLRALFPPVRMITSYVRFSAFFYMGLGVLAGFATDRLASWLGGAELGPSLPRWRPLLARATGPLVSAAILLETAFVSPVPVPIPTAEAWVPDGSEALRDLPEPGAVLDWPQRYPGRLVEVSRYFYYQSFHERPIPYDFAPTSYMPGPIEGNAFFARLERITYGAEYESQAWGEETEWALRVAAVAMHDMGFAYVVVHPRFVPADRLASVVGFLDAMLQRVALLPDGTLIFALQPTEAWEPRVPAAQ